ncbi:MAG: acyl-CoA dehydrogenase family protein [Myxococcota bacterium]
MQFEPAPEDLAVAEGARAIGANLVGRAADFERTESIPAEVFETMGKAGLMSVAGSKELGGAGRSTIAYSLSMMEIARGCASTAVTMGVTNMVGEVIAAFGTPQQIETYCPRLAGGGRGGFALSEVGAGSDPGGMRTTATLEDGEWVIRGTKQWISHGDESVVVVVWARTDGEGSRGLSCFLVEPSAAGYRAAKHEDKMGLRASHTVGLELDEVRVHESAMLGPRGSGFRIAMMALDGGRIGIASQAVGIARGVLEDVRAFVREASEGLDQGALFRIADMETRLEAARWLTLRAAQLKERGEPFTSEASMAKAFASESAWRICNEAVEILGDDGLVRGRRVERALRDVRVSMIYEGTSEIQRVVISRGLLS